MEYEMRSGFLLERHLPHLLASKVTFSIDATFLLNEQNRKTKDLKLCYEGMSSKILYVGLIIEE